MFQRLGWLGLVLGVAALGCDGADASARGRSNAPVLMGSAGMPPPAAAAGSSGSGDFGNSATPIPRMPAKTPMAQGPTVVAGSVQPVAIDQCGAGNASGLSDADLAMLLAGGTGAGMLRWLYPYDGTVFPRGMLAPLLMWDGGAADAVYVHIQASLFEYKGCSKPTADGQLQIPQDVWATAGLQTKGSEDPFVLELSVIKSGAVSGPISQHFVIAQATIKGSIYYNSYNSMLTAPGTMPAAGGMFGGFGGGPMPMGMVLRIPPGGMAEVFLSTECNGCHSVSANGSRLISQSIMDGGHAYALDTMTTPNPTGNAAGGRSAFGALYPDGSVYLATSTVIDVARSQLTSDPNTVADATLFRTTDGSIVPNTGIPKGALMPMFSPDGTLLVFNDNAINMAHGLAVMKYDVASNSASDYRMLFTDTDLRPGWPFVLPDNGGVVFTRTDGADFSGNGAGITTMMGGPAIASGPAPLSDVYIADMASGTSTILARAMGFDTPEAAKSGTTYLPFGMDDVHKVYFPTVSPVAAGGYFWLFFDALRHYGNRGLQRQLWGAAIEIAADGSYASDRSFPAFYLPGQEFGTGNHRAFAALDPCKMDGDSCTSGTDCCGGFCYVKDPKGDVNTEQPGSCSSDMPMCSKTNERCSSSADCCPPDPGQPINSCIAGFCAFIRKPI